MAPVFIPAYLPNIYYMARLVREPKISFITSGNYQKQTFRNRCEIDGANGKLTLSIPIDHTHGGEHRPAHEVRIFKGSQWQKQHWKSITSAYRSSPYFEYYEDEFLPFYNRFYPTLMVFNVAVLETILTLLGVDVLHKNVINNTYVPEAETLIKAKKVKVPQFPVYKQVFDDKYGFINNLSCIDLLFNLGPESLDYLEAIPLE